MKLNKIFIFSAALFLFASCEKDEPIEKLGKYTDAYRPEVRVTTSNRTPAIGETVRFTATTWQRNDKIAKVEFLHKLYENFGVHFELETTKLSTWKPEKPIMVVTDTIASNAVWQSFPEAGKTLNDYFVTASNAYSIAADYSKFVTGEGAYSMEGAELLKKLPNEAYGILLSQLAQAITVAEYTKLFPNAPDSHFEMAGTAKTGISAEGKANLQQNLTRELLLEKGFKSIKKEGVLHAVVTTRVTTDAGAAAEVKNEFSTTY